MDTILDIITAYFKSLCTFLYLHTPVFNFVILFVVLSYFSTTQELYTKLNRMASIAADMFVGRERFATLLLMRLTETVILWLSDDQSFWDDIEEGPRPLGPLGLQQFYLDMKFVISFASQGRYLSRILQRVINDIISKAMAAFSATGMDPYRHASSIYICMHAHFDQFRHVAIEAEIFTLAVSELPEDDWFNDICLEAIERLSGKPKAVNGDRELNSPTASVSAQSISSVRSHGSS
ncbi:hypothetical protein JRO89_XS09G0069000 [Xanthoceras sorbifolium]|uniref:Uncharacterized protein n=1 Tax=Xanthoceras sorbifolium TaxID=99658 RepID=A0ABQ8HKV1_9ROSI|nr:hypothetical protein JRO89_XS09G0069000 [Xanthoceras sorbifolium]